MSLRAALKSTRPKGTFLRGEKFCNCGVLIVFSLVDEWAIVYFPDESAVSVVKACNIISPRVEMLKKGDLCRVKERKVTYEARYVQTGEYLVLQGCVCRTSAVIFMHNII